jgi:hypothetical protein
MCNIFRPWTTQSCDILPCTRPPCPELDLVECGAYFKICIMLVGSSHYRRGKKKTFSGNLAIRKEIPWLYFTINVFCLSEARANDSGTVYTSIAVPYFQPPFTSVPKVVASQKATSCFLCTSNSFSLYTFKPSTLYPSRSFWQQWGP